MPARFVLYVNDKPVDALDTLDQAKNAAKSHINPAKALRIESLIAPAPSQIWEYDSEIGDWVHSG